MNNYSNTEKSLKRWLKTKVKITTATVIGFLIAGNFVMGAEIIKVDKETVIDTRTGGTSKTAIVGINANKYNEAGKDYPTDKSIDITYKEEAGNKWVAGILANNGGKVNIYGENININLSSGSDQSLKGVVARNEGDIIGKATGGKIILGGENTKNINIKVHSDGGFVSALEAHRRNGNSDDSSYLEINSKNLVIEASSNWQGQIDDDGAVYAVFAQGTIQKGEEGKDLAKIVLNSENTKITATAGYNGEGEKYAHSFGLVAFSGSSIEVNGNLDVTADSVIVTRGGSSIIINKNNDKTVKLNGNIEFNYDASSSGTIIDAGILVNLSNAESFLNGKISVTGNPETGKDQVNGMKLGLSNGGTWKVTGDSFVNDLTMNGGILEITDAVKDIKVDNLHGESGIATFAASMNGDNVSVADSKLTIGNAKEKTALKVGFSGINADDLAGKDLSKAFGKLEDKIDITTGADNVKETYFAEEGKVSGEITAEKGANGELIISQSEESNTVMGLKDLATINYLSWKQEMSSLTQRMGELRDSTAEHGVWARVYGGKVENGSQYDNEYQTYQVGYDKKYSVDNGKIYLGYLVSYTDGETDYNLGHGENYSVGAGIYATWLNNNGHYVDVLYKVSRLNNKFDVGSTNAEIGRTTGDYNTFGISLSAEYGKRFDFTEKWFVEPSIGMHLGRLGDETYTTNGIEVSQDSIYTAEGRIGTAVGYKFTDKGNVYVRTHVVKEFAGDIDATYTAEGITKETSEDMGDTWFEFGAGVNYRFTENLNIYADIEKSGDSTVDTKWQGNLGFRYEF